jgi:diketogulonate reductase-like aldo/keto reductase
MAISTLTLNDGNQAPWIAFGTGTALFKQDAQNAVQTAIASGFTHIDGAQIYGNEDSIQYATLRDVRRHQAPSTTARPNSQSLTAGIA